MADQTKAEAAGMNPALRYLQAVAIAVDVLANALTGGARYQTISCRIGVNYMAGGWASRVHWPAPVLRHWLGSVYMTQV